MKITYSSRFNKININSQLQRACDETSRSTNPQNECANTFSVEQSNALKNQRVCSSNISFGNNPPHIEEKDINFEVTCLGYSDIKGNTRKLNDYRTIMSQRFGLDWVNHFNKPHIVRNGNGDERINGETTALVIPLNFDTQGYRCGDHAAIVFNGNVSSEVLSELVNYMLKKGILAKKTYGKNDRCALTSTSPANFFLNPKVKTFIANFFKQKELEAAKAANNSAKIENPQQKRILCESDINISNIGHIQDLKNSREVKDYLREFLKNDRKMTVLTDFCVENNQTKEFSVILIPSKKCEWDCITVTIDKKLTYDQCKDAINHLVRSKICNVENENFRKALVDFLNNSSD